MAANLKSLVAKINDATRSALESAASLALSRTHYDVEIEHFLLRLLETTDTDAEKIFHHFSVDPMRLTADLNKLLDKMKRGNGRSPALSPLIAKMMSEAWVLGSLEHNQGKIRTGFAMLALFTHEDLARIVKEFSREFQKINTDVLRADIMNIIAGSSEGALMEAVDEAPAAGAQEGKPRPGGKTPNLDQYTVNLTENARKGKIDPVLGRDFEVRQIIDILMRRRQNNPILTGEAGVGKTAVVEGFASRIVAGDVPPPLKNVALHTLDMALLQAGAGVKGEFENRLKALVNEVKASPTPIILFIDEAHTMIGAGGQAGQNDAANILKPALARGELRTIAATTWAEYKKYFEKDPALARRFQVVKVEEPDEKVAMTMMRGIVAPLEKHHNVRIIDDGVAAAVKLSHRYIAGRQLPDKSVSVLDTACARVALGQNAVPPAIEAARRTLDDLDVQKRVLDREVAVGADHSERLAEIAVQREKTAEELKALEARFEQEKGLVEKIRAIRFRLEDPNAKMPEGMEEPAGSPAEIKEQLGKLNDELSALQGENPLMRVTVDAQVIGEVISGWTGIPVGNMMRDEIQTILNLEKHLGRRVIGQDHALAAIAQRIRTAKARLEDPKKPIGTFMLVGPSGVGKTETALTLADMMYGGEHNVITINMSEFQEAHTVSTLKGSPPGYVGYGEGGVLTEAVRRRPYSVVLLDEVEKAHPDVLELFFQVFDKGMMEDGEGREIDFKNTIIILTSNAATDTLMKLVADPETMPSPEGIVKVMKPELDKVFKPAFLGRLVIIPYYPVRDEALKNIIRLKLGKIQKRLMENHKLELTYAPELVDEVANRCTEVESGARNVDNILTNTLLPDMSRELLMSMAEGAKLSRVHVSLGEGGKFAYEHFTEKAETQTA
ncbi:MAG: type VI secretion system ATPase TssH [Bryobacterales bacterium]|nr:type VI secretion system ATPase TssH [Bryobacterales bacterium]